MQKLRNGQERICKTKTIILSYLADILKFVYKSVLDYQKKKKKKISTKTMHYSITEYKKD